MPPPEEESVICFDTFIKQLLGCKVIPTGKLFMGIPLHRDSHSDCIWGLRHSQINVIPTGKRDSLL